jgi:hypothetical protein
MPVEEEKAMSAQMPAWKVRRANNKNALGGVPDIMAGCVLASK